MSFDQELIEELKSERGVLYPFLNLLKDQTLDLEFRTEGFDIYYRGEVLVQIRNGTTKYEYSASFRSVVNFDKIQHETICSASSAQTWCDMCTYPLKKFWDITLSNHNKTEREYQQLIVRENNYSPVSISTDYFITNMEDSKKTDTVNANRSYMRPDLVSIRWDCGSQERKNERNKSKPYLPKLAIIEVKYGDNAIGNVISDVKGEKADLVKHLNDAHEFLKNPKSVLLLKNESLNYFNQKRSLGLFKGIKDANQKIDQLSDEKPEYIIALINHQPCSKRLLEIISDIDFSKFIHFDTYFACSSNLGYGLYAKRMKNPSELLAELEKDFPE